MALRKLLLCLLIWSAVDGYRVFHQGKIETRGKAKSKATFHRVQRSGSESNSSIFISASLIGAFAGSVAVSSVAPATVAATTGTAALVANCAPTLAIMTPALITGSAAGPLAAVVAPVALVAVLALIGGLVALQAAAASAAIALAFCPVSNFAQEPLQALVSSQPYLAFPSDLETAFDAGLDGGMPKCGGMKEVALGETICGSDDRECHENACRTKCCEDDGCSFYQFETDDSGSDKVVCQLGEKYKLVDSNCEKPFFGEACSGRVKVWEQEGSDHTKCVSGYTIGEGFLVDDQADCQNVASENNHCYYQYNEAKKTCATCEDLTDIVVNSIDNWKVFGDPNAPSQCGKKEVVEDAGCTDWQFKAVLLQKVKATKRVQPTSRGCRGNSAPCLKKRCRKACNDDPECKFYQFQEGESACFLGATDSIDESNVATPWFGGFVSSERQCKTGFQCPSTQKCVDACDEDCPGYSVNGPESKGRGKNKGKWCLRNAVQSLCFKENWDVAYQGVAVTEWCRGMEKVTVKIDEEMDSRETGESVCRQACCADPDCAMYQMKPSDSNKTASEMTAGSKIECWLGMESAGGKPKFKCNGKKLKRWRLSASPTGAALSKRGCTDGSIACLTTKTCVDHCRTECMGADNHDEKNGLCRPASSMDSENIAFGRDPKKRLAFKSNLVSGFPTISGKTNKKSFYVNPGKPGFDSTDQVLDIQTHSQKVASPESDLDLSTACDTLKDNDDDETWLCWYENKACQCEFEEPQTCDNWFADGQHLKHVNDDLGLLLFTGEDCSCDANENDDGVFICKFGLLNAIPKLRVSKESEAEIEIKGQKKPVCDRGTCPGFDSCETTKFGEHECGYTCKKGGEEDSYWCSRECNCHVETGEDDSALCKNKKCPNMQECHRIDYGDYGCGYGCHNAEGVFHYCTQDCECES